MNALEHPMVGAYLQQLTDELRTADPDRRSEIVEQVADHIAEATVELDPIDEVSLRRVLDRLGSPHDIAAAADLPAPVRSAPPEYGTERWAIAAFSLSLVVPVVGWIVGVALLWSSNAWTIRHKIVGTVATAPLSAVVITGAITVTLTFSDPLKTIGWLAFLAVPVATIVWLGRAITKSRAHFDSRAS